jgi:hypothetical protein
MSEEKNGAACIILKKNIHQCRIELHYIVIQFTEENGA